MDVQDAAAIVEACAVAVGLVLVVSQMAQSRHQRQSEMLVQLFDEFHSEENYGVREAIFADLGPNSSAPGDDRLARRRYLDLNQRMAYLVRSHLLRKEDVFRMYSKVVVDTWEALAEDIARLRASVTPGYATDFEWLYGQCLAYRARNSRTSADGSTMSPAPNTSAGGDRDAI